MKVLVVYAMCLLAASAGVVDIVMDLKIASNRVLEEELYNSIITGDYDNAVCQSLEYEKQGQGSIIQNVVDSLIIDKRRNTMEYCYKLWTSFGQHIVRKYFPGSFTLIMAGNFITLVYRNYNLALKLGCYSYENNERIAYGDGNKKDQKAISWKFISVWEDNKVYFKIHNTKYNQYLKMSSKIDCNARERIAKGSNTAESTNEEWFLQPAKYRNHVTFFVYNREYSDALELGGIVDGSRDRMAFGYNGEVVGLPEYYSWFIRPFETNVKIV